MGIRNIQGLFLEKFPEFNELFPRGEDGKIAEERREAGKKFIFEKMGKLKDFNLSFGRSPAQKKVAPYFEESHFTAVKKSFSPWGLDFDESLIDTSQEEGGQDWVTRF